MVTVKAAELLEKAQELLDAGYEYVDIDELPGDDDMPKCLSFSVFDEVGIGVDFDEIEHIEVDPMYKLNS